MENFNIRKLKAVHIAANFTEDIEKAERKQLTGGSWKTINGAKVYVKGSKVVAGAEGKLSGEGGSKSGSSKSSEGSGSKATSKEIKEYLKYNPSKTKEQAEKYLNSMKAMSKFKTGTPVTFKDKMGRKVSGEVVNKNGKKQVSLYRDDNYSGSSERLVSPDWSKVESFNESNTKESKSGSSKSSKVKTTKVKYGSGADGMAKVGDKISMRTKRSGGLTSGVDGEVYEISSSGKTFRLKDEFGNKDTKWRNVDDYKSAKVKRRLESKATKKSISKSKTMEDNIEKGKRVPVGTVSRGYKKVAEGKWVPVKDEKKKESPKKEGGSKNSK